MNRIKKGDKVRVISGKNKTQEGVVLSVDLKNQRAIVEGVNKIKKHQKANNEEQKGGIIEKEAPLYLSKLALIAAKAKKGVSKIAYTSNKEGKKVRIAKKTKSEVVAK